MLKFTKRVIKMLAGFGLLLAGVIMLVTPGPGWLTILLGLALLASEFAWARRLLDWLKARFTHLRDAAVHGQKTKNSEPAP